MSRARAHALIDQLRQDGMLATREALRFEAYQEIEDAGEVGKNASCLHNTSALYGSHAHMHPAQLHLRCLERASANS